MIDVDNLVFDELKLPGFQLANQDFFPGGGMTFVT
jgi:hypothetical protein